jgi:hypothetical protein
MKRKYLDSLTITVPGRKNNDGTTTPAVDFRCEAETLANGKKRIGSCDEVRR